MRYLFEKISTVAACDTLLAAAQKKKQNLERERRNMSESIDTFSKRMDYAGKESIRVQSSLDAPRMAHGALPEGKDKATIQVMIKRLEVRQALLERKAYTYNVAALLAKEVKYNKLDSQVSAVGNYIAAVQQRRTALGHSVLRVSHPTTALRPPVARQKSQPENEQVQARFPVNKQVNISEDAPPLTDALLRVDTSSPIKYGIPNAGYAASGIPYYFY